MAVGCRVSNWQHPPDCVRQPLTSAGCDHDRVDEEGAGGGDEEEEEALDAARDSFGGDRTVVRHAHVVPVLLPRIARGAVSHARTMPGCAASVKSCHRERSFRPYAGRVGGRLALVLALSGCYGGIAAGPDRGSPDGGDQGSGSGISAFAGFPIDLPAGGRLGIGAAIGQTSIGEDPEGHTPKTTWVAIDLRYTQRILPDLTVVPVLGAGGLAGDSTDGQVLGVRAFVGAETRSVPVTFGAGVVPQVIRYDGESSVRSLHVALWLARAGSIDRPAR